MIGFAMLYHRSVPAQVVFASVSAPPRLESLVVCAVHAADLIRNEAITQSLAHTAVVTLHVHDQAHRPRHS